MNKEKITFTLLCSFISSLIGKLGIPFIILITANIVDYITAFIVCYIQGTKFTSYKSFKGIAKKILMWLLVVVGAIVDITITHYTTLVGQPTTLRYVIANLVAFWLVCNELISIIENIAGTGVAVPKFLQKIIKATQTKIEESANDNTNTK